MSCTLFINEMLADCSKRQYGGYEPIVGLFLRDSNTASMITKTATSLNYEYIEDVAGTPKRAEIGVTTSPAETIVTSDGGIVPLVVNVVANKGVTYTIETQDGDTQFTQGTLTIKLNGKTFSSLGTGGSTRNAIFSDNNLYSLYDVVIFGLDGVCGVLKDCRLTGISFDGGSDVTEFAGYTLTFTQMNALDNSLFSAGANNDLSSKVKQMFGLLW